MRSTMPDATLVIASSNQGVPEGFTVISAAASDEGTYLLGELEVTVSGGKAVLAGTDTLAGSTLVLSRAIEVCEASGISREVAIEAATVTPLRALETCGWTAPL